MLKNNLYNVIVSKINVRFKHIFNKFRKKLFSKENYNKGKSLHYIINRKYFNLNLKYFIS